MQLRVAALSLAMLAGCAESLVWHGRSPDRRRRVEVVERTGRQSVRVDGESGPSFRGVGIEAIAWSPDSRSLAYPVDRGDGWSVVAGDRAGPTFAGIGAILWSPDGRGLAYAAEQGGRWLVVRGGVAGPAFDAILDRTLRWSPDGRRIAYAGQRGDARFVVDGDRIGEGWDGIASLAFSADGAHLAYVARRGDAVRLVVDGAPLAPHASIADVALAPRGGRVAYVALDPLDPGAAVNASNHADPPGTVTVAPLRPGRWRSVIDGVAGRAYDRIASLRFDESGRHVAYAARSGRVERVVLDGREGPPFDGVAPASVVFAGDRLAYVARRDGRSRVVLDGREGPPFDAIDPPVPAPAGDRVAYVAARGDQRIAVVAGPDGHREGPAFPRVGGLVWDRAGERLGYLARRGDQDLVVHGSDRTALDAPVEGSLVWSADGRRWACLAAYPEARRFYVVVDGIPRVPIDMDELAAAVSRLPTEERAGGEGELLRTWVAAELAKHP